MIASRNRGNGKRGSSRRSGMLESLEGRRLLAGNVTAVVDPVTNALHITGDNKSNQVQIAFEFVIGVRLIGLDGTTINGGSAPLAVVANNPIHMDMGNGNDVVRVESVSEGVSLAWTGPLTIETGNGNDTVVFDDQTFTDVSISTGNGNDEISLHSLFLTENLIIDTGKGSDSIAFSSGISDVIANNTIIDGNKGHDVITGIANLDADSLVIENVEVIG